MLIGMRGFMAGSTARYTPPDGVCFYFEGVPAGTTFLSTSRVKSAVDYPVTIDWGDGTTTELTTSSATTPAVVPAHTYDSTGDYRIQITGKGLTNVYAVNTSNRPAFAITINANNPYLVGVSISNDYLYRVLFSGTNTTTAIRTTFYKCENIRFIGLPGDIVEGNERIGFIHLANAYLSCIPEVYGGKLKYLPLYCFYYARFTTNEISLPDTEVVGRGAFSNMLSASTVSKINLPSCKVIQDSAFNSCSKITTVDAPNLEEVGYAAFYGCSLLENINLDKVVHFGKLFASTSPTYGVLAKTKITELNLPNVTTIYDECFRLHEVEKLTMPKVQTVPGNVFGGSVYLKELNIPSVTTLSPYAFGYSYSSYTVNVLQDRLDINIGSKFQVVRADMMSGLPVDYPERVFFNYTSDKIEIEFVQDNNHRTMTNIRNIRADNVTDVVSADGLFRCLSDLVNVSMPKVTELPVSCFRDCTSLVSPDIQSVKRLNGGTFYGCTSLSTEFVVSLLGRLEAISSFDFYGCSSIVGEIDTGNASFNASPKLNKIEACVGAFANCTGITKAHLPKLRMLASFTILGSGTIYKATGIFDGCTSLTHVYLPELTEIKEKWEFTGCTALKEIHFSVVNKESIEACEYYSTNWGLGADWTGKIIFDMYTENPYVSSGLIFMLDSVWQERLLKHSYNGETWKDVIGGVEVPVSNFMVSEGGVEFDGSAYATMSSGPTNVRTVEIVLKDVDWSASNYPLLAAWGDGILSSEIRPYIWVDNGDSPNSISVYANFSGRSNQEYKADKNNWVKADHPNVSIAATYDETTNTHTFYIDGEVIGTAQNLPEDYWYDAPFIGGDTEGYNLAGTISAIRMYDRALTAAEITSNYAMDNERFKLTE